MKQYHDLIKDVLENGQIQDNRTADPAISVPGRMLQFDISASFPAPTTKKLAFKSVVGELCGFLRGVQFASSFRKLGCNVWDANANENEAWLTNPYRLMHDHLGPVYGVQWRKWPAYKTLARGFDDKRIEDALSKGWKIRGEFDEKYSRNGAFCTERTVLLYKEIDQLGECIRKIMTTPNDRRILFHGWNPAVLDEVALPSCHLLYQFHVNTVRNELSLTLYIRSNDIGLGNPFNVAEAAALLALVSRITGKTPRWLSVMIGDAHIYESHVPALEEQIQRTPLELPILEINARIPWGSEAVEEAIAWLDKVEPSDFVLKGYENHGNLENKMKMAV